MVSHKNINKSFFAFLRLGILKIFALLLINSVAFANGAGVNWLNSKYNSDGSYHTSSDIANTLQGTAEALNAYKSSAQTLPETVSQSLGYINTKTTNNVEVLAYKIIINSKYNNSYAIHLSDLKNLQNIRGGFGEFEGYDSTALDTAIALEALGLINDTSSTTIGAIQYLLDNQESDGGWRTGNNSTSTYITAKVIASLEYFNNRYSGVNQSLAKAKTFVIGKQNASGLWSNNFESALAIIALNRSLVDVSGIERSVNALTQRQLSNGSWDSDVYSTALALQAIYQFQAKNQSVSTNSAAVLGKITFSDSTLPIAGATVSIRDIIGLSAESNSDGQFNLSGLDEGTYTIVVTKQGFNGVSKVININEGENLNVGVLSLQKADDTGSLTGQIYSTHDNSPVSGAVVKLTGPNNYQFNADASGYLGISNIIPGNYSIEIAKAGYNTYVNGISISGGQIFQIRQGLVLIGAHQDSSALDLNGKVVDGDTGQPLSNVSLRLNNAQSVTTDNNGLFTINSVNRGDYTLALSATNYLSEQIFFSLGNGMSGNLGTFLMHPKQNRQSPTTLKLYGKVLDGLSNQPVSNANITYIASGVSQQTDSNGEFILDKITDQNFEIEISAANHETVKYMISVSAFGEVNGEFILPPKSINDPTYTSSVVVGHVYDKTSNQVIENATITINSAALLSNSNIDGYYQINDINLLEYELNISAINYEPQTLQVKTTGFGQYTIDVYLAPTENAGQDNRFQITNFNTPTNSISGNTKLLLTTSISNLTNVSDVATVVGEVYNAQNEHIVTLTPYSVGTTELQSTFMFSAGEKIDLTIPWYTAQNPPGAYRVELRVVEHASISRELPSGILLDKTSLFVNVEETRAIKAIVSPNPPLTQIGSIVPVTLDVLINNNSNVDLFNEAFDLVILDPETQNVLHQATRTIDKLNLGENELVSFGTWEPSGSGNYKITVTPRNTLISSIGEGNIYVGDVAAGLFSLNQTVVPQGYQSVQAKIELSGVDTKTGQSSDPLFILVRDAIEDGANYVSNQAVSWHKRNRCLGCHIQTQSVIGLGSSLNKAEIDSQSAITLFNTISSSQQDDGGLRSSYPQHTVVQTASGAWSLAQWPNKQDTFDTLYKAAKHMYDRRTVNGEDTGLRKDHNGGWWQSNYTPMSALMMLTFADVIKAKDNVDLSEYKNYSKETLTAFGQGNYPRDLEVGTDGWLYSVNYRGRITKYNISTGELIEILPSLPYDFRGLAVDDSGTIYVSGTGGLYKVQQDGTYTQLVSSNQSLTDVEISPDGYIYVTLDHNNQIWKVSPSGSVGVISHGLLNHPHGLEIDRDGNLYIANVNGYNILKMNVNQQFSIYSDGFSYRPEWITSDGTDGFYVASLSHYNQRQSTPFAINHVNGRGIVKRLMSSSRVSGIVTVDDTLYFHGHDDNTLNKLTTSSFDISNLNLYQNEVDNIANFFINSYQSDFSDRIDQAFRIIGMSEALSVSNDASINAELETGIQTIKNILINSQNADGGWGRYSYHGSDPMITALVGIALDYTHPSVNEPFVRNSINYLLNTQGNDNSWPVYNGLFSTRLASTSLVMAYLPTALDRLGGIDIDLNLKLPVSINLTSPSLAATNTFTSSNGDESYIWNLSGVTGAGRTINFDLDFSNLNYGETRSAANEAFIEFKNSFTDEIIKVNLDIPKVTVTSDVTLGVKTDKPVYADNQKVFITPSVVNTSADIINGNVKLSIRNPVTHEIIASLPTVAVQNLGSGESVDLSSAWNTADYLVGGYEVFAQLLTTQGTIVDEAQSPFSILYDGIAANATVVTDKPIYSSWDTVLIDGKLINISANVIIPNTYIEFVVTDILGNTTYSGASTQNQLLPNGIRVIPDSLVLQNASNGQYDVVMYVKDSFSRVTITTAQTSFIVDSKSVESLVGTSQSIPRRVYLGESATCNNTVYNRSKSELTNIAVNHELISLNTGERQSLVSDTLNLTSNESNQTLHNFDTQSLDIGVYYCILSAVVDGVEKQLAASAFEVLKPPINIEPVLELGPTGRLLVLLDEFSENSECHAGNELSLSHSFTHPLAADATVHIELQDASGSVLDAEDVTLDTVDYPVNTLASTGSAELRITDFNANGLTATVFSPTGAALNGSYQLKVTVTDSVSSSSLNSGLIEVACNQPMELGAVLGDFTVTTLILPPVTNATSDPHGPQAAPTLGSQRHYLEQLLTHNGWSYTIVTDAGDFAMELRTGGYTAYALFSEQVKLAETVQKELREAVYRGEGLLVAGSHDNRNHNVFDALGVSLQGKLADADGVQGIPAVTPDTLSLAYPDKVLKVELDGATSASGYLTLVNGVLTTQTDGNAAMATQDYGLGRSVFVGFDLLAHATAVGGENSFADLILNWLDDIPPEAVSSHPGSVVPVQLTLTNLGIATPGEVVMTFSDGVSVIDSGLAAQLDDGAWHWFYDLAEEGSETLILWVRLPNSLDDVTVSATINTGTPPDLTLYDEVSLTLIPRALPELSAIQSELSVLANDKSADKAYGRANNNVEKAQTWLSSNNIDKTLSELLRATDELASIDEERASIIRLNIDGVIVTISNLLNQ